MEKIQQKTENYLRSKRNIIASLAVLMGTVGQVSLAETGDPKKESIDYKAKIEQYTKSGKTQQEVLIQKIRDLKRFTGSGKEIVTTRNGEIIKSMPVEGGNLVVSFNNKGEAQAFSFEHENQRIRQIDLDLDGFVDRIIINRSEELVSDRKRRNDAVQTQKNKGLEKEHIAHNSYLGITIIDIHDIQDTTNARVEYETFGPSDAIFLKEKSEGVEALDEALQLQEFFIKRFYHEYKKLEDSQIVKK